MIHSNKKQKCVKVFCLIFTICLNLACQSSGQSGISDKRIENSMRKIGHEVLQCIGDHTSRVLPIEQNDNQYKIPFESKFSFDPEDIVLTVDRIIKETKITSHYFVEVVQCESNSIVHSYEISHTPSTKYIACIGRVLPVDCYSLIITIVENPITIASTQNKETIEPIATIILSFLSLSLIGFSIYNFYRNNKLSNRKNSEPDITDLISIGRYHFDQKNMMLLSGNEKIELSSKESRLLSVLHDSVNTTVQREVLLNKVWKDEGDYVGRTLDVFISKLRKKIDSEVNAKIITERGVGYRLVINDDTP